MCKGQEKQKHAIVAMLNKGNTNNSIVEESSTVYVTKNRDRQEISMYFKHDDLQDALP